MANDYYTGKEPAVRVEVKRECRLCNESSRLKPVRGADARDYFLCGNCRTVSVDRRLFPTAGESRRRYEQHNNALDDEQYIAFLNRMAKPMLELIRPGMRGLDYGCGPCPALSELMRRAGAECSDFDPLFFPAPPRPPFDFILSTETFEHFFEPRKEIEKLSAMLPKGGLLGVMTETWDSLERFRKWHYARDFTHVSFYHSRTFQYICGEFGFEKAFDDGKRVFILRKR